MKGVAPLLVLAALVGCDSASHEAAFTTRAERDCRLPLFYALPQGAPRPNTVAVVGTWNGWGQAAEEMLDPDGDRVYVAWVEPPPGRHEYRIWVDNSTFLDAYNPLSWVGDHGWENSLLDIPDCDVPALEITALTRSAGELSLELQLWPGDPAHGLDLSSVDARLDGVPLSVAAVDDGLRIKGPLSEGKHDLRIEARDTRGVPVQSVAFPVWGEALDWRDAIIYQVMVDRFRRGGGEPLDGERSISFYHGGDLWGVIEALEEGYFERLGVNALWISPMYDNPEGQYIGRDGHLAEPYHGYWPAEPRIVEPRFGGEDALDALVAAAHARGIRVIMDTVLNHIHEEHPYWRERRDDSWFNHPEGDCVCGFTCPWGLMMQSCWFDPFMPDLDWSQQAVVTQMIDDAMWWMSRFDLDGLRLDAVPMMPRYAMRHLRARIAERYEGGDTHIYLVGETYTQPGEQAVLSYFLGPHTLSGQFDFPVMWQLRDALAGRAPLQVLDDEVHASEAAWMGSGAVMAPFLGNHDVPRFTSDVNNDPIWRPREIAPDAPETDVPYDLLRMAWTFVMTQPGAPVIYYGDEIGLPGANDPDNRRDMRFGDALAAREAAVLEHVQNLGTLRACSDALRRGQRLTLAVEGDLYAYGRDAGDGEPVVVLLNRAETRLETQVALPEGWPGGAWVEALGGTSVSRNGDALEVVLEPRSSAVLLVEGSRCSN